MLQPKVFLKRELTIIRKLVEDIKGDTAGIDGIKIRMSDLNIRENGKESSLAPAKLSADCILYDRNYPPKTE